MARPKNPIKTCGYAKCKRCRKIDTNKEEYTKLNNLYFHKECFQERSDLQLIRNLWAERINENVSYSYLNKVLNSLLDKGFASDYMVFTLEYVISHRMNLNYPNGFIYFLEKPKIQTAYKQKKLKRQIKEAAEIQKPILNTANEPKFSFKPKQRGFTTIFQNKGGD
ncbi:MAG: hypothetical protein IIT39_05295 [Clostridia bacterium]|nr:hypothetical protein [Clostridia bacterium]